MIAVRTLYIHDDICKTLGLCLCQILAISHFEGNFSVLREWFYLLKLLLAEGNVLVTQIKSKGFLWLVLIDNKPKAATSTTSNFDKNFISQCLDLSHLIQRLIIKLILIHSEILFILLLLIIKVDTILSEQSVAIVHALYYFESSTREYPVIYHTPYLRLKSVIKEKPYPHLVL